MPAEPRQNIPKDPSQERPAVEEMAPAEDFAPATLPAEEGAEEAIRKLQAEKMQLADQLLRKQAELENFRKRSEREKEEFQRYTLFEAVKSLLPILDGFEFAKASDGGTDEYRKGIELICQQLRGALQKLGLKAVETKGEQFDPRQHEAVVTIETDQFPENEIVEELQRGYYFKDRLLRPAMVKVAKRRDSHRHPEKDSVPE